MTQHLVSELLQKWIDGGKKPVVLFSSLEHVVKEQPTLLLTTRIEPAVIESVPSLPVLTSSYIAPQGVVTEPVITEAVQELAQQESNYLPTPTKNSLSWPKISLPEITVPPLEIPTLPRLPKIQLSAPELPSFSLPKLPDVSLPHLPRSTWDRVLKWGSNLAYGTAIAAFVMFFTPIIVIESQSHWRKLQSHIADLQLQSQTNAPVTPTPTPTPKPEINSVEDYFSLEFPRLKIASRIIPNVDASDNKEYESALKIGVAHAAGTGLPDDTDQNKTIYLFAHSTNATFNIQRYNAQFYALKDSVAGDEIKVRYWGKDYTYVVRETKIVDADDTSFLEPQMDEERLILQTCYPPGTTWKRLVVIATPAVEDSTP